MTSDSIGPRGTGRLGRAGPLSWALEVRLARAVGSGVTSVTVAGAGSSELRVRAVTLPSAYARADPA
ncbi:hypothetical protein [Streptomyces sp. NPDC095602]|uniref:hypothetical protein n=1 Tax=Streptomyces sp. NPDC095602 TaxID=3155819 RepID=UPI003323C10C